MAWALYGAKTCFGIWWIGPDRWYSPFDLEPKKRQICFIPTTWVLWQFSLELCLWLAQGYVSINHILWRFFKCLLANLSMNQSHHKKEMHDGAIILFWKWAYKLHQQIIHVGSLKLISSQLYHGLIVKLLISNCLLGSFFFRI